MSLAENQIPHQERISHTATIIFPPNKLPGSNEVTPGRLPSSLDVGRTRRWQKIANIPHISQRVVRLEPQKKFKRDCLVTFMNSRIESKLYPRKFLIPGILPFGMEGDESGS